MATIISNTHNLDIVSLISDNPITKLTKDYQTPLLTKLSDHFITEEHRLFLSSFFCYLNYDTEKDFVIDLDKIWKWLGFSRKDVAKRLLERNFDIDVDYVIGSNFPLSGGKIPVTDQGRGRPEEAIMITIDTFKLMSMAAKTDKAKEIRKYYVKLEKIIQETLEEQAEDHRKQLLVKDQEIKEKVSNIEQDIILKYKKIVYAGYIDADKTMVKFGYTDHVEDRLKSHKKTFGQHFTFEIHEDTVYNRELETMIKTELKDRIIKDDKETKNGKIVSSGKKINGEIHTEIIQLELGEFELEDFRNEINKFKQILDGKDRKKIENKAVKYDNEELKEENKKLKQHKTIIERKLYNITYIARNINTGEEIEFKHFSDAKDISGVGAHSLPEQYLNHPNQHNGYTYRRDGSPYWEPPENFKYNPKRKDSTHSKQCKAVSIVTGEATYYNSVIEASDIMKVARKSLNDYINKKSNFLDEKVVEYEWFPLKSCGRWIYPDGTVEELEELEIITNAKTFPTINSVIKNQIKELIDFTESNDDKLRNKDLKSLITKYNINTSTRILKDTNFLVDCGAEYSGRQKLSLEGKSSDVGYYNIKFKNEKDNDLIV